MTLMFDLSLSEPEVVDWETALIIGVTTFRCKGTTDSERSISHQRV
jgi:hypothetical protein